jgi:hypothetical protein
LIYLAAVFCVAGFALGLQTLGVVAVAAGALQTSRDVTRVMRDQSLSDLDKERATQKASITLLKCFLSISIRTAVAVGISVLPLIIFEFTGLAHWTEVIKTLSSLPGILLASGVMLLMYLVTTKRSRAG